MSRREYAIQFSSQRIDKSAGIIFGVAVMTAGEYSDRTFKTVTGQELSLGADRKTLEQIMASAQTYANGLKVKADHRGGVFATGAHLKNFRIEDGPAGPVLRADLHVLKTEANRDKLFEMAETIPDTFGLSVAFSGGEEIIAGKAYDRCTEIYSADLVADPAANPTGLFSRVDDSQRRTMNLEEVSKECSALAEKLKGLQDAVAGFMPKADAEKAMSALTDQLKEMSTKLTAAETTVKELSTKHAAQVTDSTKLITETAAAVAKEFAKIVGTAPAQAASAAGTGAGATDTKPVEKFEAAVIKHFATTKNKVKATELAIHDEPEGYKQFRTSGRDLKFAA